ncbi:MAG: hypothetical protein U9Q03_05685 [Patescibacteria group bacterium]|nr:hypothetical protein [Patescibacteria group bacterium]
MGFFISAVSQAEYVGEGDNSNSDDILAVRTGRNYERFLDGKQLGLYRFKGQDANVEGYSGIGLEEWTDILSRIVHRCGMWDLGSDSYGLEFDGVFFPPFYHSGAYGPETCKRLAAEFAAHRDKVAGGIAKIRPKKDFLYGGKDGNAWWLSLYDQWQKVFEVGSDSGFAFFR